MDQQTILQLNQLNRDFYIHVAEPFNQTRKEAWTGWTSLLQRQYLDFPATKALSVLDIGCGNGRFGLFLNQVLKRENFFYYGIDLNQVLLQFAQNALSEQKITHQLEAIDIVEDTQALTTIATQQQFELVVMFGVLHHLPNKDLREDIFSGLHRLLSDTGRAVITTWRFLENPQLKQRIIHPKVLGINPAQLDEHDYILDWQREKTAYRYCHYYTEDEIAQLCRGAGLEILNTFLADGRDQASNSYYVLQKN